MSALLIPLRSTIIRVQRYVSSSRLRRKMFHVEHLMFHVEHFSGNIAIRVYKLLIQAIAITY
jgi:porphobilinogen deaminase